MQEADLKTRCLGFKNSNEYNRMCVEMMRVSMTETKSNLRKMSMRVNTQTALGGLGPELIETIRSRASGDSSTISSAALTSILTSPPFSLPGEVAESMVKSKGVLSGPGPHGPDALIDTMRFVARCVPSADEELFAPVRLRLMEKYHTMLAAFRAFSREKKGGSADVKTISKADLTAGIVSLNLGLPDADLDRMCSLADADGNGKIEYQASFDLFQINLRIHQSD